MPAIVPFVADRPQALHDAAACDSSRAPGNDAGLEVEDLEARLRRWIDRESPPSYWAIVSV